MITLLNSLSIRIDNSYIRIILSYKLAHALSIATLITRKAAQIRKPSEKKVTRKDDKEKPGGGKENEKIRRPKASVSGGGGVSALQRETWGPLEEPSTLSITDKLTYQGTRLARDARSAVDTN